MSQWNAPGIKVSIRALAAPAPAAPSHAPSVFKLVKLYAL